MKILKKSTLATGLFLLFAAGSVYGSSVWQQAILATGKGTSVVEAAQNVLTAHASAPLTRTAALQLAKNVGKTPEVVAIVRYMARLKSTDSLFKSAYTDNDVEAAANAIIANDSRNVSVGPMPTPSAPQLPTPSQSNSGWGWFGGGSSSSANAPVLTAADVQAAVQDQLQKDLALAAASNTTLAQITSSGKSGISLYSAFIDYIFSILQQAVNCIADAGTQQQVLSYIQNKVTTMKASVASNNYEARMLGRLDSKKAQKKNKQKKNKSRN